MERKKNAGSVRVWESSVSGKGKCGSGSGEGEREKEV